MNKTIRWQQRFQNLQKAFTQLAKGVQIVSPSDIEQQGIIQSFEFTFELSWKTLKDYLESKNVDAKFPRDVIKQSFQYEILANGEIWLEMLEKRNIIAHTYDDNIAKKVYTDITKRYYPEIKVLVQVLEQKVGQ